MSKKTENLRVVFMGTPDFSVPALTSLIESSHSLVGVVTQPDRKKGRGKSKSAPPIKKKAVEHGISVFQPEEIDTDESMARLVEWNPDVMVVVAYGQILPGQILDLPPYGCINIHASLLPKYRGAAPINWAIIRGETETGISIMKMDEGMDTGPVYETKSIEIPKDWTAQELHDRLSELGAEMIPSSLRRIADGKLEPKPQNDEEATYAPMLSKSDGRIDWRKSADKVANHVRGVNPWPGAFSYHNEETNSARIKFHCLEPIDDESPKEAGTVTRADIGEGRLEIACGEGVVRVTSIQAPGKKAMGPTDFLNGYHIESGDRFI